MTNRRPSRPAFRLRTAEVIALPLALAGLAAARLPLEAKPLDAEACARIKLERDALEAAGTRSALSQQPPTRPIKTLDERSQKLAKLIQLDGQLRFRCGMDLPIASLKPELLIEVPDTVEGEAVVKPVPRKPAVKKAKAAPDQSKAGETTAPAPQRTKSATAKPEKSAEKSAAAPTAGESPAKARAKPKPKVDDAYRPATKSEGSDTPQ